jgi:hypothetical protein
MAKDGDTITFTFNGNTDANGNLIPQQEDISSIDEITVDRCDGAGGSNDEEPGGSGGRVENTVVDVSNFDTLYIWVGEKGTQGNVPLGRYDGEKFGSEASGAGSTEIAFVNTDSTDSADEPFIVAAAGGGGGEAAESGLQF